MSFLFILAFTSDLSFAIDWYCRRNGNYLPINHHRCTQGSNRSAFCDHDNNGSNSRCGSYVINDGQVIVTYNNGAAQTNAGAVQAVPDSESTGGGGGFSETTGGGRNTDGRNQRRGESSPLANRFPPRTAAFSESRRTADSYTNAEWLGMSILDRARYVYDVSAALLAAHNLGDPYSAALLTCKAINESCFRPQDESPAEDSTASGLSQVTRTTLTGTFPAINFRSRVPGFENITDGREFHRAMAASMPAQIEAGIAVMLLKQAEGARRLETILTRYGPGGSTYARILMQCASCVDTNGLTMRCLNIAHPSCR